eukprot:gnl/Carplike_NY0171/6153_a8448_156.p1 GENE.gnl/Carplike_NY0171/6153_a8448_156~~gnl/Carplike_NY0171/6153_a8448_156.p1  ORF type:complete len:421 (-),score=56.20 gnl/Carplike_NY0171/6153_a8448_156:882-2033(-)
MLAVLRLISISYNISDGKIFHKKKGTPEKKKYHPFKYLSASAISRRQKYSVAEIPSLLSFFSYLYYFPHSIYGPMVEYRDFNAFISLKHEYKPHKPSPGRFKAIAYQIFCALPSLFGPLFGESHFPSNFTATDEFAAYSPLRKILYIFILRWAVTTKYYFAWSFVDLIDILTGLSENTETGTYHRFRNVDVWKIEFSQNFKQLANDWNRQVSEFLRYYCYERIPSSSANIRQVGSFVLSAIWHGCSPGYPVFFVTIALVTSAHKEMFKTLRPLARRLGKVPYFIYDIISRISTPWLMSYFGIAFFTEEFSTTMKGYKALNFIPHIVMGIFLVLPWKWLRKILKIKRTKNGYECFLGIEENLKEESPSKVEGTDDVKEITTSSE